MLASLGQGSKKVHRLSTWFEISRGGQGHHIRSMEGLRGLAVFLVFLVHFSSLSAPYHASSVQLSQWMGWVHTVGNAGVDLFFVLSGYLIYGAVLERQQPFLKFMARRVQRIYPAFLVVFVLYLLLSVALPAESKVPHSTGAALVYLLENVLLLPGLFPVTPMITVAWSLSYEMFYYLAIPLLVMAFAFRERERRWRMGFFLVLVFLLAAYSAWQGGPVRLIMFISGILLYEVITGSVLRLSGTAGFVALVAGLLGMLLPVGGHVGETVKALVLFVAFFVLCGSCFANPLSWLSLFLTWTPVRWLGNMSYSYYLLHGLTLKTAFHMLTFVIPGDGHGPWLTLGLLPLMFLITLAPAALLFILAERPYSLVKSPLSGSGSPQPAPRRG